MISFGRSLLIVNRVFSDGASVQVLHQILSQLEFFIQYRSNRLKLHRYDKSTIGNSYLAVSRLLRGALNGFSDQGFSSVINAIGHIVRLSSILSKHMQF